MAELLLELYSEEIPARMQIPALEQLEKALTTKLKEAQIEHANLRSFVTPHRLTVVLDNIPSKQKATKEERRGPRADAPEKAIEGFYRSAGVTKEQLVIKETPKGNFYFAVIESPERDVAATLTTIIEDILHGFSWPKSMRWGEYAIRWVRPLHHILSVFDEKILPVSFGHITSGDTTKGHRFMAPEFFKVTNFAQYQEKLQQANVVLCHRERKEIIAKQINTLVSKQNLALKDDPALLDEITGLVEYPVALLGEIDHSFLSVPQEALISSMRSHQKYFSLLDDKGKLAPYFITVANCQTKDKGKKIIHGNQRVLSARLGDAKFFWDQDRQKSLEAALPQLKKIIFHAKLGSVADKVERITALAQLYAAWVPNADCIKTQRAAQLCKADLVTEMVGEFPELQGLMGYYYANDNQEDQDVAIAIKEHYSPLGPSDNCPKAPVSICVALADKMDTLVGLFAAGDKPTGSKDPYALRRAALGVIRLILENNLRIPLQLMCEKALAGYPKSLLKEGKEAPKENEQRTLNQVQEFFRDRLRVVLKGRDIRYDIVDAVMCRAAEDDLVSIVSRAEALNAFVQQESGVNLLAGYKRALNIVEAEKRKGEASYDSPIKRALAQEVAETALLDAYEIAVPHITESLKTEDYTQAMQALSKLRKPIDHFFDQVTVNDTNLDIRKNRLALLSSFVVLVNSVADFSKIDG